MVTTTSPARLEEPGLERRRLAEVAPEVDDDDVRRLGIEPREHLHAAVGRAVVDEDDLERLASRLERSRDLAVELLKRALLVEQGNDDGDHFAEGIGLRGRHLQRLGRSARPLELDARQSGGSP